MRHAELVRLGKGLADFGYLSRRFVGAKIDRRANRHRAQVVCFLHSAKQNLVKLIRQRQQLVVIDLHDERNLVRILPRDGAQHAKGRSHCVAAAFDRQLHDVFRIEVLRVRRKRSAGRMLDALVDRQDRKIPGAREPAIVEKRLQGTQNRRRTIRVCPDAIDKIRTGQIELILGDRFRLVIEQRPRVFAQELFNAIKGGRCSFQFGSHYSVLLVWLACSLKVWKCSANRAKL